VVSVAGDEVDVVGGGVAAMSASRLTPPPSVSNADSSDACLAMQWQSWSPLQPTKWWLEREAEMEGGSGARRLVSARTVGGTSKADRGWEGGATVWCGSCRCHSRVSRASSTAVDVDAEWEGEEEDGRVAEAASSSGSPMVSTTLPWPPASRSARKDRALGSLAISVTVSAKKNG